MEAAGLNPVDNGMGITEILLIVLGLAIFTASFLIPEKYSRQDIKDTRDQEEKLHNFLEQEMKQAQYLFEEKADETITAATEKTERYMERITNEKIMAVQEYSDTVLSQIHKNHEEAVFLYDMLNNKHTQVKNAAAEINIKVEDAKADLQNTIQEQFAPLPIEEMHTEVQSQELISEEKQAEIESVPSKKAMPKKKTPAKKTVSHKEVNEEAKSDIEIQFDPELNMGNNKDMILQLHKEGKSNMAIAKSLGLGVGEVKLVIDLFEGV